MRLLPTQDEKTTCEVSEFSDQEKAEHITFSLAQYKKESDLALNHVVVSGTVTEVKTGSTNAGPGGEFTVVAFSLFLF